MNSFVMPTRPARIDRVEVHVGARRHRDGVLRGADHVGGALAAERVRDRVVDAFAEEQDRLAPAAHAMSRNSAVYFSVSSTPTARKPRSKSLGSSPAVAARDRSTAAAVVAVALTGRWSRMREVW